MSYTPTNWQTGDTVTAEKLNNMEAGIENAANPYIVTLTPTAADLSGTMDKTPEDINSAIQNENRIIFAIPSLGGMIEATQFLYNQEFDRYQAYANITFDPGTGTALIQIQTNPASQTYFTQIFPLTPMS